VATLAAENPNDRGDLMVSPSETAINRFLKWVDEPKCRQLALNAALPQVINRDIIAILHDQDDVDEMFNWLKQMPFVEECPHGWVYQDIVRAQMLQHKRLTSPQSWVDLHGKLSDYYNTQQINLGLNENRQWSNLSWQSNFLHILYHNLCQFPQRNISDGLNKFLNTLDKFSSKSADTILQAGKDSGAPEVQQWGEKLVKGLAAYHNSDYQAAIAMYTDLLNQPGIEERWKPTLLSMRGFTYSGIGQPQKASQDLERAAELDPNHVEVLVRRGQTYFMSGQYNEAIQEYNRATNLYPNSKIAVYSRGETYLAMRCYEDALSDFNSLIELEPNDSSYIAGRAQCYQGMRRYEESLKDLDRVIEIDPEHIFWVSANRSLTYRLAKRYEEALKHIERAIEFAPQHATLIARRGEIYLMLKYYNNSIASFSHALQLDLKYNLAKCFYFRALAYRATGQAQSYSNDLNQAIQIAQQDFSKKPQDYVNAFNLALYYLAIGNIDIAKQSYRDALSGSNSQLYIQDAIQDLGDFLNVFPNQKMAKRIEEVLRKRANGEGTEANNPVGAD
jgi:tetratricopeptide (TPR) repeat protein